MQINNVGPCLYVELPLTGYREAWKLQQEIVRLKSEGLFESDVILVMEHPPVYTLGRRGGLENLCVSKALLEKEDIDVVQVERGGDITYHGPGQLVAYPLIDIQRARLSVTDLVSTLEEIMIGTAAVFGVDAGRNPLNRGVWVGNTKLGSVGIAIRKGTSFHGMALNINLDLTHFSWINPCGLQNVAMTSLKEAACRTINIDEVRRVIKNRIGLVLAVELIHIKPEDLFTLVSGCET